MATKNFTQFSTTTLTTGDYIVGYKQDGSTEIRTQVKDVVNLVQDSDNQTLSFNESSKDLSITNGNTVSLSALTDFETAFSQSSAKYEDTSTVVQTNSATTWNYQGTDLKALSGNWQSTYTIFSLTSALAILDGGNAKGQNITIGTSDDFHVRLRAGTSTRINILSSGEVGIGITNPNNVPLGFPLTVNGTINSVTDGDSTQWKQGYDIGTAYSSVSSSFATNTLLQSTSALLTPLTTTNTLTSELVLNTDFDSYKTEVASATATLLPITTYQSASGSFATNTLLQSTSALLTPLTLTNTLTGQLITNTSFSDYQTNVASATATLLPTTTYQQASGFWQTASTITSQASANIILDGGNAKGQNITIGTADAFHVRLRAGTSTRINILSSGQVGIGISNPNNVPLGFPLTVNGTINSNTDGDSTQWKQAYNVATTYQDASGSFATNTSLQSTSALLTPLTTTNTLTGQLVLNTDFDSYKTNVASATATLVKTTGFDSYKTEVASATATLLPITTYQSASGSFATNTTVNSVSSLLTPLTLTNTLTSQLVLNTDFSNYQTNVASATATLLPIAGGTLTGNLTVNGTVSASSTIFSADRQVVTTNTTTVPGTSAVTSILAVSALPVPQETGVLYIVI
jgi:hypothetical protein